MNVPSTIAIGAQESLYGSSLADLEDYCRSLSVPAVHARTLFRELYKRRSDAPWTESSLPMTLKCSIPTQYSLQLPPVAECQESGYDHSVKFAFAVGDGQHIESVLMPETSRLTLCVSSQVGCRQGCAFCITGRMGLIRNLSAAEIVGQVVAANRWICDHPEWSDRVRLPRDSQITNIVFMGMGEPLDNVQSVLKSIEILIEPYGLALGLRKISVSTAGHIEGMRELLQRFPNAALAFSLHAAEEELRRRIMPISKRWSLAEMISELRALSTDRKQCILIQYTLMRDINDSVAQAEQLAVLLAGINVKVNLIPLNAIEGSRFAAPDAATIQAFRDVLQQRGLRTMVRYSKGQDIAAACGQLVDKKQPRRGLAQTTKLASLP